MSDLTEEKIAAIADGVKEANMCRQQPPAHHPKSIDEVVGIVLHELPEETRQQIRSQKKEDAVVNAHFSMGLWIRKNLICQNPNKVA